MKCKVVENRDCSYACPWKGCPFNVEERIQEARMIYMSDIVTYIFTYLMTVEGNE